MRALDVATFDGFWAFEMERRGAEVTAVDIGSWLEADVPRLALQQAVAEGRDMSTGHGFRIAKELLGSKVERQEVSVYDLSPDRIGEFDAVLVSDLLIHLRDPQRALEAVYSVVRPGGYAIIAEPYNAELEGFKDICLSQFVEFSDYTWWSPSTNTLRAMMRIAGFDAIEEVRRFTLNARAPSPITKVVFRAHRKEKGAPNG
jgi:tRNA (mo5U34)-methyltransferase